MQELRRLGVTGGSFLNSIGDATAARNTSRSSRMARRAPRARGDEVAHKRARASSGLRRQRTRKAAALDRAPKVGDAVRDARHFDAVKSSRRVRSYTLDPTLSAARPTRARRSGSSGRKRATWRSWRRRYDGLVEAVGSATPGSVGAGLERLMLAPSTGITVAERRPSSPSRSRGCAPVSRRRAWRPQARAVDTDCAGRSRRDSSRRHKGSARRRSSSRAPTGRTKCGGAGRTTW